MPVAVVLGLLGWWQVHPVVGVLAFVVGYLATCALIPMVRCGWCRGTGRLRWPGTRTFRPCDRCDGEGAHFRVGTRLWRGLGG